MADIIKQFFCKHNYGFVGTVETIWVGNDGKDCTIRTDFLECEHCKKRKILYQYEYLVGNHARKYFELWKHNQYEIPKSWFKSIEEKSNDHNS